MDENESLEVREASWCLDCSREEVARLLDCPTFAQRTPEVDAAWDYYLGEHRQICGYLLTTSNQFDLDTPAEYEKTLENWEHWNRPSEIVRADHLNDPAIKLGRNRDGYSDELFGCPSTHLAFDMVKLLDAPRIIAVLEEDIHVDDQLDVDRDYLYEAMQRPRSAEELLAFADRLYNSHLELVGQEMFDALLDRRMEGDLRIKLFNICKTQQAMDMLTEEIDRK